MPQYYLGKSVCLDKKKMICFVLINIVSTNALALVNHKVIFTK